MKATEKIERLTQYALHLSRNAPWEVRHRLASIQVYTYVSPDFDNEIVAVANWNNPDRYNSLTKQREKLSPLMEQLKRHIEKIDGVEIAWSDEITRCMNCGILFNSIPSGYYWTPSYVSLDGDHYCTECADIPSFLELAENHSDKVISDENIKPGEHGYTGLTVTEARSVGLSETLSVFQDPDDVAEFTRHEFSPAKALDVLRNSSMMKGKAFVFKESGTYVQVFHRKLAHEEEDCEDET